MMERKLAFERLFKQHYEQLFLFACQFLRSEEECHDIVNDAYEDVWLKMEQIKPETVKAYLFTSVRNRCINFLRHEHVRQQYIDYCTIVTSTYVKPDELVEQTERDAMVERAINELKPPADEVVRMYANGKKYREIAEEMNITLSYVKKIMRRALAQIKDSIVKNV